MTYIDNLCQALLLCERNPAANGQTYWVSDRRPYSNERDRRHRGAADGERVWAESGPQTVRLPSVAGQVAGLADGLIQKLGLYQQKIHVLSEMNKNIACSVEKAQRELGYAPTVDLEEGMRRSLAWCRAQSIDL